MGVFAIQEPYTNEQGCARDIKARDRDETATLASPAETLKFETRPRRNVCSSRDVIETCTSFIDCNNRPRCYLSRSLFLACSYDEQ